MEEFIDNLNTHNTNNNLGVNINLLQELIGSIDENIQIITNNSNNSNIESSPQCASENFINNLKEIEISENNISCSICLEDFKVGEKCIKLPCEKNSHYFHKGDDNCPGILTWFKRNNTCPICRTEFPSDNPPGPHEMPNQLINFINRSSPIIRLVNIGNLLEMEEERQLNYVLQTSLEDQ